MEAEYSHAFFDAILDGAILLDKTGRIIDWNNGATQLFGYLKKEVLGKSLNIIFQQNYPFPKIIQDNLPAQKKWGEETRFIRKNGIKGICKTHMVLVHAPGSQKQAALVTLQNMTQCKTLEEELNKKIYYLTEILQETWRLSYFTYQTLITNLTAYENLEKSLRESEMQFRLLAENATDIISRHAADGTYLYVSPSCQTTLGYTAEELLNCSIYKMLHLEDSGKFKKIFNRRKDTSKKSYTIQYRIRRKEGDYRWYESNIRPIFDEKTKHIREFQVASRDINARVLDKRARIRGQQLARVSRLSSLEEMASGMAHEMSQPLAAIVNYTQGCVRYLQTDVHDPDKIVETMKKAVAQAERAGEVIHRLKNFFCKGHLTKSSCKVNSLIRETVSLIRNELNSNKTKIDFFFGKDVHLISADTIQIQQVLINLLQNAMDAMHEAGSKDRRVRIHTKTLDVNTIEITIHDTGPGFSKEVIHRVFEPFFTTKAHGRGIGLAICRSIIEAHGGQFMINPNTHNDSWIRFTLPIN